MFKADRIEKRDCNNSTPLLDFQKGYPVIFDLLHSAFGWMPSSTCLLEQIHGGNRHSLHPGHRRHEGSRRSGRVGFRVRQHV